MNILFLIGRIIFGGFFIYSGVHHFTKFEMMSTYSAAHGIPAAPVAIAVTGLLLLLGGISILAGYYPRIGIVLLIIFLIPVTFMMHNFWALQDPQMQSTQLGNFLKNIALLGALIMLLQIPEPWSFGLKWKPFNNDRL